MTNLTSFANKWDLDFNDVCLAQENINSGISHLIAFSGKIGAGKDTIAPMIMRTIGVPEKNSHQEFFARPLKEEVNDVIRIISKEKNKNSAIQNIANAAEIDKKHAIDMYDFLSDEVLTNPEITSYSRTFGIRKALQYWGTEVRRAQDENYWVKKMLMSSFKILAAGESVYLTDTRFPNEAAAVQEAFGKTVRLNVSYEEQSKRIMSRDGIEVSEDARNHPSETALDDYKNFDIVVNTDNKDTQEIVAEILMHNQINLVQKPL